MTSTQPINTSQRTTFDQAAKDYDEARPGYPDELIKDVISISKIPSGGKILEIGCGTGQATIPFAQRGYLMLCLEIGKELAALAAKKCRQFPKVQIKNISFEDWKPTPNSFDLVISATAFHWIPPEIGYPKAARVLKGSGYIAIFDNIHPTPFSDYWQKVQRVYREVFPGEKDRSKEPSTEEKIRKKEDLINGTGLFEKVVVKQYHWSKEYNKERYIKLLNTYSSHRTLPEERRSRLFRGISTLIDEELGGKIKRPYISVLYIAKKA